MGHPVSDGPWPDDALPAGARVRVVRAADGHAPWPAEFTGVIDTVAPPEPLTHRMAEPGEFAYFVAFDQPQVDSDGDGPYRKAQIWGRYLERLSD